ncbi:zinc finger protein 384b isoform X7 [Cynoglossus semilaevis]|uniref:zinc finger protein 384b isoform X7 n=1 Tax=Cynoglossus semilaevis TaxID=244447 RepID=UPI0004984A21|nr:zinc finger protein 384 isoform X7 [Cynoglossus semilaevis]
MRKNFNLLREFFDKSTNGAPIDPGLESSGKEDGVVGTVTESCSLRPIAEMMEDSHFNSSYFWSPISAVPGQSLLSQHIENAMFLNKMKEQQEKASSFSSSSASHYQTALLTIPSAGSKSEGGGQAGSASHLHPPHSTQNITVLPVPSTGIMTAAGLVITTPQGTLVSPTSSQSFVSGHPATTMIVSALHPPDKKEGDGAPHVVVMPTPSKRGRKKKTTVTISSIGGQGHETIMLAQALTGGSQHHSRDPYDLSNEDEDHGPKDSTKTYRNHTESKPHKCPHCTKSFANSSYLAQHIRIHTGVKPYSCSYCEKSFRQLSHLQQHNRIHTGERPYKCIHPGCDKSFTQLSNLQSHRRQHNKDKPYKCPNCNKGYIDAASLEVHMSTHTVKHARIYSCGLCNRSYTSETYLVRHMEKHNPDQLTVPAVVEQQNQNQTQGQAGAQSRLEGTDRGSNRSGGGGGGGRASGGQQGQGQSNYPQTENIPCPFDLHQYKTVSANDLQYKPVSVSDISSHKDLCLTVSASAIQVEHLNS